MKKLTLIIGFILLLCCSLNAQNDTTQYSKSKEYGWFYTRLIARLTLTLPKDTVVNKMDGSIASLNGTTYVNNGGKWFAISAATSVKYGDTATMLQPYRLALNSIQAAQPGYLPYVGATSNTNLGSFNLSTGGFITSSNTSTGASLRMSPGSLLWTESSSGFTAAITIASLGGNRSYLFPGKSGTVAMTSDIPNVTGFVQYSDTALMLQAYRAAILTKIGVGDTSAMLLAYRVAIIAKVKYTDTSGMLIAYQIAINGKVKYTDTSGMLSAYRTALLNRVDLTTNQTAAGNKTWTGNAVHNGFINQVTTSTANSNMFKPNVFLHTVNTRATAGDTASAYQLYNIFNLGSTNQSIRGLEIVHDVRITDGFALATYTTGGNSTISTGIGYVDGVYTNVPMIGNTGVGALFTITVVSTRVSSVQVTTSGSSYTWWGGDMTVASNASLGGTGSGFSWLGPRYQSVFAVAGPQNTTSAALSINLVKPNNSGMGGQQSGGNFVSFNVAGSFAGGIGYTNFGNIATLGFFDSNGGGAGAEAFGISSSQGLYVKRIFSTSSTVSLGAAITTNNAAPILCTIGSGSNYTPNTAGLLQNVLVTGTAIPVSNSNVAYGGVHINTIYRTGVPLSYTVLNAGTGYTNGVYNTSYSGGHGNFVDNVVVTVTGTVVTSVINSSTNRNNSYIVGDTLTLGAFGGGTGATIKVASVTGTALALDFTNETGNNYLNSKAGNTCIGCDTTVKTLPATLDVNGSIALKTTTLSASAAMDGTATVWFYNGSGIGTYTLPSVASTKDRYYIVRNIGSSVLTVAATSGDNIYGATGTVTTMTLAAGIGAKFSCNGTYYVLVN